MTRLATLLLATAALAALSAACIGGEVKIAAEAGPLVVSAPGYEARIEADGCLTNLRVGGREFLAPNVTISRGSYFFFAGPEKLDKIERPSDSSIAASNGTASIQYDFGDREMTWRLANKSEFPIVFFFVFMKDVNTILDEQQSPRPAPVNAMSGDATFVSGNATLRIQGGDRLWGPWQGPHQVYEVKLEPKAAKTLTLTTGELTEDQKLQIVKLFPRMVEPELQLFSPRNYQVVQRDESNNASVAVTGHTTTDANEIRVRVTGDSTEGPLSGEWKSLPIVRATRSFATDLTLPAGGWYALEVEALRDGKALAATKVDRFGVGEVFVGAGQSNSTNFGETRTRQTSGMVSSFGGDSWQLADDPQPGVADRTDGGSFWPAFGDAMYERYGVPIGVAATGYGGTSVSQWQPDGELFPWMMMRVQQLGPGGFRALLWHQGESDVAMPPDEYYIKLKNIILSSRAQAGWNIPWIVAQATYHNPENPRFDAIRQAQKRMWGEGIAMQGPDTDTLTGDCRDLGGLGIHLSPKGLHRHGQMWSDCAGRYIDSLVQPEHGEESPSGGIPTATAAVGWPEADALFHRDPNWFGGDDAYSVDLGNERVAWFFGDSFVAPTIPGSRTGTTMVHNTVGIQTGYDPSSADFKAYWKEKDGKPASFIEDEGDDYFWPGGSLVVDGKLIMFLMRARTTGTDLGFDTTGWGAVLIDNLDESPDKWNVRKLEAPQNDFRVLVGSASIVRDGDHLVAFSVGGDTHDVFLVRWLKTDAMAGDLSRPEWWAGTKRGWVEQQKLRTLPAPIMKHGQTEFTVNYFPKLGRYVLFQFEGYPVTPIGMRTANALTGPWTAISEVYRPKEMRSKMPGLMLYAAKAHPELVGDGLVLTYATNTEKVAQLFTNPKLYYPRFFRVVLQQPDN